ARLAAGFVGRAEAARDLAGHGPREAAALRGERLGTGELLRYVREDVAQFLDQRCERLLVLAERGGTRALLLELRIELVDELLALGALGFELRALGCARVARRCELGGLRAD